MDYAKTWEDWKLRGVLGKCYGGRVPSPREEEILRLRARVQMMEEQLELRSSNPYGSDFDESQHLYYESREYDVDLDMDSRQEVQLGCHELDCLWVVKGV